MDLVTKMSPMEVPVMDGLEPDQLIGHGGCGYVYRLGQAKGPEKVLKIFDETTISRNLLEKMTLRLETGGWPSGVMPIHASDFGSEPPYWITPLVGTVGADGKVVPSCLQMSLGSHPGTYSWKLVKSLAKALAGMHERRVAHGNIKPGNIFIGDNGDVLLADWTMGNMPGAGHVNFTDAVLYQPPEQLRNPSGYLEEAGYRWDAYAFGTVAFRVLTGRFPRCHETFSVVAPEPGTARKDGIQADFFKIARNVESKDEFKWPDEAPNELEAGFREWINRCLSLDPLVRPASMMEVSAAFERLEHQATQESERALLMDQRRNAERSSRKTLFFSGAATAAAIILGALWYQAEQKFQIERQNHQRELSELRNAGEMSSLADKTDAESRIREAEEKQATAENALKYERELGIARLESSRLIGDRLFAWAMEKGHRRLPPLDGRELRLKTLERYYEDFLERTAGIEALQDEQARVRLQLAELSLAAGNAPLADKRLTEALAASSSIPRDSELKLRVATDWLLLALLKQSSSDPAAGNAFISARSALEEVPQTEVDADRLQQLISILDFHEANLLAAKGESARALEQLMRATQSLNRLADQRPDAAILRSELAACYLSSATILEGMGNLGDAREVRTLASLELRKLIEANPTDFDLRLELAGCYGAMAEAAVLSGDITGADSLSREATGLLDRLLAEQPDHVEALSRKASQLGLRAGILRDRGLAADALKSYDDGIRMLEGIHVSSKDNATASFRLAILLWQKGRMVGMAGDRPGEIALFGRSRDLLSKLETANSPAGPRQDQLQSTSAYLLGDLGHANQLWGNMKNAGEAFSEAIVLWEGLLKTRPQSEEYSEGLAWCRQRLEDLK